MIRNTKFKFILIVISIIILYLGIELYVSSSMSFLPKGEMIESIKSPNGEYIMNSYFIDGGTISANAIRVEIVYKNKSKNIYWSYPEDGATIKWLDNDNVKINNVKLNIHHDKYKN